MKHIVLLSLFILLLAGCGSGNVPLSGTVTFSDDGSPVSAGWVAFDDGKSMARGEIKPDGHYVMGFDKMGNGVPKGDYVVTISGAIEYLPNPADVYPPPTRDLIDPKYAENSTSGLTFKVDGTQKSYDIKVDRAKK